MANATYWGRYYKLVIQPPGGEEMVFETKQGKPSMDIKFDVTYARGQLAREGTVSILGLGYDHIHAFLELAAMARGKAMSKLAKLSLEVGYFSAANTVEVLNGFVWYGSVTSPPNMWLTLKVSEYNPIGNKLVDITDDKEMKAAEYLNYVCEQFTSAEGVDFDWMDYTEERLVETGDTMVKGISFPKKVSLHDCLQKLTKELSPKLQFIFRTYSGESARNYRIIEIHDKDADKVVDDTIDVDAEHGLLSVTGIDAVSGCVTTFIDSRGADDLCHLRLRSDLNPQANGTYYITKKSYKGHFMGPEWYMQYYCSARDNGDEDEEDEE